MSGAVLAVAASSSISGEEELREGGKELPGPLLLLGICPPFENEGEDILECFLHGLMDLLWNLPDGGSVEKQDLLECNLVPPIQGVLPHIFRQGENNGRIFLQSMVLCFLPSGLSAGLLGLREVANSCFQTCVLS
eukprot:3873966-Prorocentrum_lima.AAC.1